MSITYTVAIFNEPSTQKKDVVRQNPIMEKRKWTQSPTPKQDYIFNFF